MNREDFKDHVFRFLSWQWVKELFYWIVLSAGTVSELCFLIASVWMCLNSNIHALLIQFINEQVTTNLTALAVAAFTALPVIIVGLAVTTVYGFFKTAFQHKLKRALVWGVLFALPTVVFLSLDICTIGFSSVSFSYTLPDPLVALRSLSGYFYGFLSLIYVLIGKPDFASKLTEKEAKIEELEVEREDIKSLVETLKRDHLREIEKLKAENEALKNDFCKSQNIVLELSERASSLELGPIEANYPLVKKEVLDAGKKSIALDQIMLLTGFSKSKILKAGLKNPPRSKDKDVFLVTSVIDWLKVTPPPKSETFPVITIVKEIN